MLATAAAAASANTLRKKYSFFIYSEAEPHAMYAKYKQTLTLCVLQYLWQIKFHKDVESDSINNIYVITTWYMLTPYHFTARVS